MDAGETVRYLKAMRQFYSENDAEKMKDFIAALDDAILAVSPPVGAGQMRWIYLPDADLLPYEHLNMISGITAALDKYKNDPHCETGKWEVRMSRGEADLLETALAVYQSVLMDVHKDRIREGLTKTVEALGEAAKEGRLDGEDDPCGV